MSFIGKYFGSPKTDNANSTPNDLPNLDLSAIDEPKEDSSTTSDVDTDEVLYDSEYGQAYKEAPGDQERAFLRRQAMKKIKSLGDQRKRKSVTKKKSEDKRVGGLESEIEKLKKELAAALAKSDKVETPRDDGPSVPSSAPEVSNLKRIIPNIDLDLSKPPPKVTTSTVPTAQMAYAEKAFQSDIGRSNWPSGTTKETRTTGTDTDPVLASLKKGYGTYKSTLTRCRTEIARNRLNKDQLAIINNRITIALKGMCDILTTIQALNYVDAEYKAKAFSDYCHYQKGAEEDKNKISKLLSAIQQKRADFETGTKPKHKQSNSDGAVGQNANPKDASFDKHLSDDLNRKTSQDWKEERKREADAYKQFEAKKLLEEQKKELDTRNVLAQAEFERARKETETQNTEKQSGVRFSTPVPSDINPQTQRRSGQLSDYIDPDENENTTWSNRSNLGPSLTPEQFAIWIELQRHRDENIRPPPTPRPSPMMERAAPTGVADMSGVTPRRSLNRPPGVIDWYPHDFREKPERPIVKVEPSTFDGTSATENWTRWKQQYSALIGQKNFDDATKLFLLMKQLKGEPLKIAESLTTSDYDTRSYCLVWDALEENYGGIERMRNSIFSQIKNFEKLKKFDKDSTLRLLNLLIVIEEKFSDETGLIDQGGVLNAQIKEIIPQHELTQYFLELAIWNKADSFRSLKDFVTIRRNAHKHSDINTTGTTRTLHSVEETKPLPSPKVEEDENNEEHNAIHAGYTSKPEYKTKYPPKANADSDSKPPSKYFAKTDKTIAATGCPMCKKEHQLWQCPEFKMIARTEKLKFIFANKCCLHCLNPGHGYKSCTFFPERLCGIDGCEDKHHRQLHNFPDSKGRVLITAEEYIHQESVLMAYQTMHSLEEDDYIAIRTTTATISHNGKERRVVIAMDPCSNSTNIDEEFAKEMGLEVVRTGIVRNINFLESSATVNSDLVSFTLSPLDKNGSYDVKAFTVKNLIAGTPVVDWRKVSDTYAHLKEAKIPLAEDDDRVHILLGTDYAYLNGSCRGIFGKVNEPIAELTKLGWAFSGRVKSHQILPAWISQYGHLRLDSFTTFTGITGSTEPVINCVRTPPNLVRVLETALKIEAEDTLQDPRPTSQDVLDKGQEEFTKHCEQAKSVFVEKSLKITHADIDFACLSACDPNPGLFTYLNLAPNVVTEEDKLTALDELIRKSWEIEALGLVEKTQKITTDYKDPSAGWTKAEKLAAEKMNITYLPDCKQFQMSIPWKDDPPKFFKSNRAAVKARQDGVCNRLGDKVVHLEKIFEGYLEKGYVRKLSKAESMEDNVFYLPFFTVLREDSTTPVRIVWDCAARYGGKSLNSEILATPNCLQPLFKVLMRVRKFPFVVMSDISEMFLKVRLDPKDRRYHRFTFNGEDYEWLVMLFGNRSSPDGSQMVIQENCRLHGEDLPEAVETVNQSCYMDDGADSRETEEIALQLALQLIELFKHCGMPVHKFFSNSKLVCETLDKNVLAKQIKFNDDADTVWESGKVLGMAYSVEEGDVFTYASKFRNVADIKDVKDGEWTKRNICSASAAIFDPLGLISPFVVRARVIMQEVWKQKLTWDEVLPLNIQSVWMEWLNQVFAIPDIKIPRWSGLLTKTTKYQIHTFCDASEEGYCVAVYIRIKNGTDITTNLIAAKSRVSPLKAESISRQELVGCVLAVRLTAAVQETYPANTENTFYWTDSQVCLCWINYTAKSFKAYVAHRVGEIQTHTEPRQWLHVPTAENPADVGTRSISASDLKESELWWTGPSYLKKPVNQWPKTAVVAKLEPTELKETIFMSFSLLMEAPKLDLMKHLHPRHYSVGNIYNGYSRCVRQWSMLLMAIRKFKAANKSQRKDKLEKHDIIKPADLETGRRFLIRQSQLEFYEQEIKLMSVNLNPLNVDAKGMKTEISQFNPFLDEHEIMRSNSRLSTTGRSYETSHPIILHRRSEFTKLLVTNLHFQFEHPVSFAAMKASVRQFYAILGLGTLCAQIKSTCPQCKKLRALPLVQQMSTVPERRIGSKMCAFEHVGIDFAGPFELKMGRAKARKKVWVLVLTCMTIRAVHFEVTGGMDTSHVINAISRFTDVRGIPSSITSDNQTSFHKANVELTDWYKTIDWEKVSRNTGFDFRPISTGITWHFNPPVASHFGGIFEIMVKAMKRAMKATIGRADLDEEEFRTAISKMSYLINSRPIQVLSDVHDYDVLTPNHFLLPNLAGAVFPPNICEEDTIKLSKRLQFQVEIQQHVWKRFQEEVIPMLGPRKKWCSEKPNLQENDVVMEMDDQLPRGAWRLLRVISVLPSKDGLVRKVEVRSSTGKTYLRPIHRLIPIVKD